MALEHLIGRRVMLLDGFMEDLISGSDELSPGMVGTVADIDEDDCYVGVLFDNWRCGHSGIEGSNGNGWWVLSDYVAPIEDEDPPSINADDLLEII